MEYYVGLDVSLKEISICVVDRDGATVARRMRWGDEQAPISNRHLGLTKEMGWLPSSPNGIVLCQNCGWHSPRIERTAT